VPEVAGRQCPTSTGVEWDIGMPVTMNGTIIDVDSPTPTDFGSTVEDGELGTTITCTVTSDGLFEIDGGGTDPQIAAPDGTINFTFDGTATVQGAANFSVFTPRTRSVGTQPGFPACTVTTVHEQGVGALWADFQCPALTDPDEPNIACGANGTIVVEYCKG